MKLAYVRSDQSGQVNRKLSEAAQNLIQRGVRVVGTIQIDTPRANSHKCDMDVRVLPDGNMFRISQNLGPNARGCHLDTDALEQAVVATMARLDGADLLIINKFGKREAEGSGFRSAIEQALEAGIPVVVAVNAANIDAWNSFTGGLDVRLPPDRKTITAWCVEPDQHQDIHAAAIV